MSVTRKENKRTCFDCLRLVNTATAHGIFRPFDEAKSDDIIQIPVNADGKKMKWIVADRLAVARDMWDDVEWQERLIEQLHNMGVEYEDTHLDLEPVTPQFEKYVQLRREDGERWNRYYNP